MNDAWPDAIYQKTFNDDWNGNPLIECLPPPLSEEQFISAALSEPTFSPEERLLPSHFRRHFIDRLVSLRIPTNEMSSAYGKFDVALRRGYASRNPREPETRRAMYSREHISCIEFEDPANCLLLTGLSGSGKTTLLKTVVHAFPQVIVHHNIVPGIALQHQVVWLKVDCPHDAGLRTLCLAICDAFDRLLNTTYLKEWSRSRVSIEDLLQGIAAMIRNLNVGVLVLDELQHLRAAKAGGEMKMLNFLVNLSNTLNVPLVFAGTYTLESIMSRQLRNARRATDSGTISIARLKRSDPLWGAFVQRLWKFQWVMNPIDLSPDIEGELYEHTQGLRGIAAKLFIGAQNLALDQGTETVSAETLREAYARLFKPLHAAMNKLRLGTDERDPVFDALLMEVPDLRGAAKNAAPSGTETGKKKSGNGRKKRPIDPSKCDRPSGLPGNASDQNGTNVDVRAADGDAHTQLAALGLLENVSDEKSVLSTVV